MTTVHTRDKGHFDNKMARFNHYMWVNMSTLKVEISGVGQRLISSFC